MGAVKVLGLAVAYGPAKAPWGFLLVFVLPFGAGPLLLKRHPRAAAAITGIFAAVFATVCALVIGASTLEPHFMDYVTVFIGGPAAMVLTIVSTYLLGRPGVNVREPRGTSPSIR